VEAFWLLPDKRRAAAEVARVLRPGGRFVFTTWEAETGLPGIPPQVSDHRPLLEDAGFSVLAHGETVDWKRRQLAVYERIVASAADLTSELGEEVAQGLIGEARTVPTWLAGARRVLITAEAA
jgi:SAM-dependent methyltransferase